MHHLVQIRSGVPLLPASKPLEGISKIQHSSRLSLGVELFLLSTGLQAPTVGHLDHILII